MIREQLIEHLHEYASPYPEESAFIGRFLALLEHPGAYHRDHLPGHMTGSAWITSPDASSVLLTHHSKLLRWLQPGGHADGDEDILRVAQREGEEESGLRLRLITPDLFDIDIHPIPARADFTEHLHFDIRFWFTADPSLRPTVAAESMEVSWIEMRNLPATCANNRSIMRMAEKSALGRQDRPRE